MKLCPITPQAGFTGAVSLSLVSPNPLPAGVSLSPSSVNVSGSSATQTLTIATTTATPVGAHTLTLRGTSGAITREATLGLTVEPLRFIVNTPDDTVDSDLGDGRCRDSGGRCSLRAAVMQSSALNIPVIIEVPAGTYALSLAGDGDEGGDLDLKGSITLRGAGREDTILDGNGNDRVLEVHADKSATLQGLTVRNGSTDRGGGIFNNAGTLTLANVTLRGNSATGEGGGIYNAGGLTLTNVILSGNSATNQGGGIANNATLTLTNVTLSNNSAGYGGGILNFSSGNLTLTNVTLRDNRATDEGGGIYNTGTATLTNATLSGNKTTALGTGEGGGIWTGGSGTLRLVFSTLTGNSALRGGGIRITGGTTNLKGVILSGNNAINPTNGPECQGSLTSQGFNLIWSTAGCSFTSDPAGTDIVDQSADLAPLANNGGAVQTHLPNPGSPALDKVPAASCTDLGNNPVATDARGVARPQGSDCDIGAVERN